jgi:hypothetical protein
LASGTDGMRSRCVGPLDPTLIDIRMEAPR